MNRNLNLFLLAVLSITGLIYLGLFDAPQLTWDDDSNVFANPYFQAGMLKPLWTEAYFGLYVPVTSTVWAALYWVFQGAVWPFRVLNLVLHLCNIVFVWLILRTLSERWRVAPWAAMVGLAIFALHPMQVQAVAWISGGRDLLGAFFALAAVTVYFRWPKTAGFAAATVLFTCGLLSKPSTTVLPLLIPLLVYILDPDRLIQALKRSSLWLLLALGAIGMTWAAQLEHLPDVPWVYRPLIMADATAFYAVKFFTPWTMAANYERTPEFIIAQPWWPMARGAAFLVVALVGFRWAARHDRRWLLGLIWLGLLLPVSGIVVFGYQKISTVADHYHYLPMAVVATLIALALSVRPLPKTISIALVALITCALAYASFARAQAWKNNRAFFTDMARTAPNAYSTALGMSIVMCDELKEYAEGIQWTEVALRARPDDILALANQAFCHLHAGHYDKVIELELTLRRLDVDELARKQPTAFSSLLASIGTAMIETKDLDGGYQFLCDAYLVKPAEPNHLRNLQIATEILKSEGLDPRCNGEDEEGDKPHDVFDYQIPDEEFIEEEEQ